MSVGSSSSCSSWSEFGANILDLDPLELPAGESSCTFLFFLFWLKAFATWFVCHQSDLEHDCD